ncbi:uncharacterized protein HRG_06154 [Hirsutella rhossiliensis]|uniref:Uncharacterized protein n=1 Tax=Hirsutella rhossiliensis TaxID=111463 RepID=A0A9P8N0D8_9HYPO|nr:uncharacterized protein HRG_06154 [Hirsutella rhossiliensis]KAH0963644.1 hypothetical protein HRG_06154 [Hirsutella rhossiliensis]
MPKVPPKDTRPVIPLPRGEDDETVRLIKEKLPTPLGHLAGFFSKKESNQLPPLRGPGRDMKIYLTKPLPERSRGVYRNPHHLDELLRKTIQDYLDKGFIESCWPGFASPAFFVPKGDMGMD